ncbi:MAG TPA: FAD-dependent oxidoreductase [Pseudonocardia sp.]|nr:FAD-dependent oxidoreductase [Pseudonocardia sp.]
MTDTRCVVVGGGPAGMVLGLLLARGGVRVTVLEKHADFLRDFRGDTVHASTLTLLDELGLGPEFARLPGRLVDHVTVELDAGSVTIGLDRLPGAHQHIAMVPQWDFLELLATAAEREPTFTLIRNAEVTGLITEGGRVAGVRYRDRTERGAPAQDPPAEQEIRAVLTVGCDGRGSVVRAAAGLATRSFGAPMDVWWFRLPRHDTDRTGLIGRMSAGHMAVMIDRGDYWQCAYLISKGSDDSLRAAGIEALRAEFAGLLPWTADRLTAIRDWDDVKLLDVKLDRVRRWSTDGLLLIGDAAHAMSPVGGVGINLAVADAVAAARLLAPHLRTGQVPPAQLASVQRRRRWPTAIIQGGQRLAHRFVLAPRVRGDAGKTGDRGSGRAKPTRLPLPLRLVARWPALQALPGRMVAIGPLPEHAPEWARRAPAHP